MRVIIYPYKMGSRSAGMLTEALRERGHRVLKVFPDRLYRPRNSDYIINWGNSTVPEWLTDASRIIHDTWLNSIWNVGEASNKVRALQAMQEAGVTIPEFTTDTEVAHTWYREGLTFLARTRLQGHSGIGIEICKAPITEEPNGTFIQNAPLYVKYIKKAAEYRVHVFNGQVIDIQQKRRRNGLDNNEVNFQIRSHENGWVFTREDIEPPPSVLAESINAVNALGLNFGAVDVIWNNHYQQSYVLEVNTAPGLEGQTITSYVNAIEGVINE